MATDTKKQTTTPQEKSLQTQNEEVKLDPTAFAPQVFLLDLFSEDDGISGLKLQTEPNSAQVSPNVPKLSEGQIDRLNSLLDINFRKIASFVNEIPTNEIAQLVPEINMFVIDTQNPANQLRIPLSDPASLNKSKLGTLGYYSGNTIGLSSLQMTLDGSRNPAYNKAYLVKMNFVLDSINTFTDQIPGSAGFGGLTYADIFRSGGSPGSLNDRYFIKLTISHASSPRNNILEKYELNSDDMTFCLSLTLRKSSFGVGENLKTTVDVTFTGYEENLYERKDLFDFLSLDLEELKTELTNKINKSKNSFEIAKATAEEKAKRLIEIEKESYDKEIQNLQDSLKDKYFGGNSSAAKSFIQQFQSIRDRMRASGELGQGNLLTLYEEELERNNIEVDDAEELFSDLVKTGDTLVYEAPERFKKYNEAVELDKNNAIGKARADFESTKKVENAKLDNVRMNEISRVLETAFFGKEYYDANVIKTIELTSEQLQKYFQQQGKGFAPEIKDLKSTDSKDSKNPVESKPNPVTNTATPDQADHKQINELRDRLNKKNAELSARKNDLIRQNKDENQYGEDETYKRLTKEVEELANQLKNVTQTSQPLGGSIADIMNKLNNFKQFDYILLGDLLRLTFNKLFDNILLDITPKDNGTGGFLGGVKNQIQGISNFNKNVQAAILGRTRLLLSDIVLPKGGQTTMNVTKNLFNLPISIKNLKFIFADKLFGKSKNSYTLFELIDDIANLISLSFQNKAILINNTSPKRKYTVHKATYSLQGDDPNFKIISTKNKTPDLKHGVLVYFRSTEENFKRDPSYESNLDNKIPHLYFGGYDRGAVKKLELELHQKDNMQLAVMEQLGGGAGKIIPAFFKSKVTLIACPIFYLGMEYYIATPTINTQKESPWLYAQGFYGVKNVTHTYSAGGAFETVVEGIMLNANKQTESKTQPVKIISAEEAQKEALKALQDNNLDDEARRLARLAYGRDFANRSERNEENKKAQAQAKENESFWEGTSDFWKPLGREGAKYN